MVQHAIHALALDEKREPFVPTLWEKPQPGQTLTQVWFSGSHADCGGSYDDTRAADITLAWMISQLSPYIEFDLEVLKMQYFKTPATEIPKRKWACGKIHDPFTTFYRLAGNHGDRTPMGYNVYDHMTGKEQVPLKPLVDTNEKMHASVRLRMGLPGKGLEDKGDYNPESLTGWKVHGLGGLGKEWDDAEIKHAGEAGSAGADGRAALKRLQDGQGHIFWQKGDKKMPEEAISNIEYDLLMSFLPTIEGRFLAIAPKHHTTSDLAHRVENLARRIF